MGLAYSQKITTLDFSDFSGGINTTDPHTDIKPNQAQYALNAFFTNKGFGRPFGYAGLKNSLTSDISRGYGIHIYEKSDGTETLLCVVGSGLYSVDSNGHLTGLIDMDTLGTASAIADPSDVDAPIAEWSASVVNTSPGGDVTFTDLSTNTPTSWDWDYGDSSTHGTTQNPTHHYSANGAYSVTLTATNLGGSSTHTATVNVGVE